ncbi:MAG: hypothetical protein HW387_1271 [Parachlamydiales bacterium]|nr:hypothetical protein [Parachlamydiales bacterium]
MIVKDESAVIRRCLASVKPFIDCWVIVDTGSVDGTQTIIREFLKEIPGELHERPWIDFAYNRNAALDLAKNKCKYLLLIDADERLECLKSFAMPELVYDFYVVIVLVEGQIRIHRELLIKSSLDWKWVGAVHEGITCTRAKSYQVLQDVVNIAAQDGQRSRNPKKFLQDAQMLEKAIEKDPKNGRNVFYLAFSYDVGGEYASALKNYEKRVEMAGFAEEVFYSLYRKAWLQEQLKMSADTVIASYSSAYLYRPTRAEPLFCLANYYIKNQIPLMGYFVSKNAIAIPLPNDTVLVDYPVYSYRLLEQHADSCFLLKKYDETIASYRKLLANKDLPDDDRQKIVQLYGQIDRLRRLN